MQKPKTLILEHPVRAGYTLLSQKPSETTSSAYRFEVKLAPAASEKFAVEEERVYDNTVSVSNMSPDILFTYLQNKSISETARRQLQQIADLKRQIADADEQIRGNDTAINDLIRDQDRIRQNLTSLNNVSGQQDQVQKYSRQLASQETTLAALRDTGSELRKKKISLEGALNTAIEKLAF